MQMATQSREDAKVSSQHTKNINRFFSQTPKYKNANIANFSCAVVKDEVHNLEM